MKGEKVTYLPNLKKGVILVEIAHLNLAHLKPYKNNPRLNDKAVKSVAKSIKEFGFKVPIVIDKDHVIVTGHTRYKAAEELGMDLVPCIIADDLTDDQVQAFRVADNRVSEVAEWDFDKLLEELNDIEMDMSWLNFSFEYEEEEPEEEDEEDVIDVKTLEFGGNIVPLSADEYDHLLSRLEDHIVNYGSSVGFVEKLLDI